jgi:DNA-binding transcriptional ArsR family regulator
MGVTKTENFTEEQNSIAQLAKVLGHPARIAILQQIIKQDTCICGDLVTEIRLAQATISQHLKELKNSGIIKGSIEGTTVCYCIDQDNWKHIQQTFSSFFNIEVNNKTNCC